MILHKEITKKLQRYCRVCVLKKGISSCILTNEKQKQKTKQNKSTKHENKQKDEKAKQRKSETGIENGSMITRLFMVFCFFLYIF